MSGSCRHMAIERVVTDTLRNGLSVGDRLFKLLASSCSQLRDHGAWFYAVDGEGYCTDMIRYWMGDFSGISSTAKKMARMGQCFSSTEESVKVPLLSDSVLEVPDIKGKKNSATNEQYIFSDGIGMISAELLGEVHKKLKFLETPSAIQIRYAGYKGMLCLNPSLPGRQLVLRASMRKFNCVNSEYIEVIKISAPRVVFLNRQLITLLEQLGVPSRMFFCLQQHMVTLLTESLVCDTSALQVLDTYVGSALPFNQLARHGFSLTRDPFVRSMLFAVYRTSMESLLSKSRIAVPPDMGRNMFGVLDETRTLNYGEVFVQYTSLTPEGPHDNGPETTVLTGSVLVTKCPCLHPGDVRKFTAVDVTALHHIKDCIVFPANGWRPHPDEMAGSDLDGDEYIVIWDESLFFPGPNREPMVYGQKLLPQRSEPNLVDSMAQFISDYILNDNVGIMSNAHLALADKLERGVFSKPCLSIAKKISTCLDFAKTGVPALLERNERPEEYPDFMDKGAHKNTYRSSRVLGHLYRFQRFLESVVSSKFHSHLVDSGNNIKLLELCGWNRYKLIAEELLAAHQSDMDRILKQYGIKSEAEIVSGYINDVSASNKGHYDKSNVEVLVAKQYRAIVESTRERFFKEVNYACRTENAMSEEDKKQILLRMASACYMVTYCNAQKTYSSFPWSFADVILLVMESSSFRVERTSKNLLVSRLNDQLAAAASEHVAKKVALGVVLKWAEKEDLILKTKAVNCARICKDCLEKLFAKSVQAEECAHAQNDPDNMKPLSTGHYVTSFLRYVSSSSVVFPECDACSRSSQTHTLTMAALRTYSMLSILCDLCHLGLNCDASLHEPIQEIKEGNSVRIKVSNPALWDLLVHSQDEVACLLCSWSGVQEVRIRRGSDRCSGQYIVVSSIGRDWQRWFLEELLLQPWFARAVLTRSLAEFIRA
uniref:RNA-dependent RNA polymerase n=1 Tax=Rhipicephalus microplus TaxID=6941 RepID=A0A6M2D4D9_RHIMP